MGVLEHYCVLFMLTHSSVASGGREGQTVPQTTNDGDGDAKNGKDAKKRKGKRGKKGKEEGEREGTILTFALRIDNAGYAPANAKLYMRIIHDSRFQHSVPRAVAVIFAMYLR